MGQSLYSPDTPALLTDLYELTMMAGYYHHGRHQRPAVFEYFFRDLPRHTGFCVFAGLGDLLRDLDQMTFSPEAIHYLDSLGCFEDGFLKYLQDFRFSCDVWAAPEGSIVFANEPLVRVAGPIDQAQLVESIVLNRLNFQTLIATKAARVCFAAEGEPVYDFGLRRAQGPDGAVSASRAAYIGGCAGTSNALAGKLMGIPVTGTMAHSWVMSYPSEEEAFDAFLQVFPERAVLLVDTYDTASSGIPAAVKVMSQWKQRGWQGRPGIRLDSGDLAQLSKLALAAMQQAGLDDPLIVGSNSLDEDLIADLKRQGAKVNAWGVGTELVTGGSESSLGGVYKLVAAEEGGCMVGKMKVSSNRDKTTDPGVKMPVRFTAEDGRPAGDVLFADEEDYAQAGPVRSHDRVEYARLHHFPQSYPRRPLLAQVMEDGELTTGEVSVEEVRDFAQSEIEKLPAEMRRLRNPERYWVGLSTVVADAKAAEVLRLTEAAGD